MNYLVMVLVLLTLVINAAELSTVRDNEPFRKFADMTYRELKENDARGQAVFTVDNRINELTDSRVYINFIEDCGYVKSYNMFVPYICKKLVSHTPIYTRGLRICELTRNGTICSSDSIISGYTDTYETDTCWQQVRQINTGMTDYKVEADIQPATCKDGSFGYKVDWIPVIETDLGQRITKREWAWWNASYSYKLPLNCSNLDDGVPFSINGTSVSFGGQDHVIWTACQGANTSLYFNTASDWMIANDSHRLPWEVEIGDGSSYQHASLWSDYIYVNHMNITSSSSNDSSTTGLTGTIANSPIKVSGVFGGAIRFDGSAPSEYISHTDVDYFNNDGTMIWFGNHTVWDTTINQFIFSQYDSAGWYIQLRSADQATGPSKFRLYTKGSPTASFYSDINVNPGWEMYTAVQNSSGGVKGKFYYNITDVSGWDVSSPVNDNVNFLISTRIPGSYDGPILGEMDEIRYSSTALGLDYLKQIYYNYKNVGGYGNTLALESLTIPPPPVNATSARSYSWIY